MPPMRLILASSSPLLLSRLSRDLASHLGISVSGQASDLSGIYMLAEREQPDLALVGRDLSNLPDFEGLMALFRVLGTALVDVLPGPPAGIQTQSILRPDAGAGRAEYAPVMSTGKEPRSSAQPIWPGLSGQDLLARLQAARKPSPSLGGAIQSRPFARAEEFRPDRMILIGASTGGIDALLQILAEFPANCPPTAIVQHTGSAFSESLIRLFARSTAARVVAATPALQMQPGTVVVGAGCKGHLTLRPGRPPLTDIVPGPPVSGHTPSVDALFRSAVPMAQSVVAALLTGMGRDGAQGLLELRRAGARTIGQDEASSVVYGMPRAAAELGAVESQVPLPRIARGLLHLCSLRNTEVVPR